MAIRETRHQHRRQSARTIRFTRCVNPRAHNLAAHGGQTEIETCRCGAVRYVNRAGRAVERSEWILAFVLCGTCQGRGVVMDTKAAERFFESGAWAPSADPPRQPAGPRWRAAARR